MSLRKSLLKLCGCAGSTSILLTENPRSAWLTTSPPASSSDIHSWAQIPPYKVVAINSQTPVLGAGRPLAEAIFRPRPEAAATVLKTGIR